MTPRPPGPIFNNYRRAIIERGRVKAAARAELALDADLKPVSRDDAATYNRAEFKITPVLDMADKTIAGWLVFKRGVEISPRPFGSEIEALAWLKRGNSK